MPGSDKFDILERNIHVKGAVTPEIAQALQAKYAEFGLIMVEQKAGLDLTDCFHIRERPVSAFAGICDIWNGEPVFAFLTCAPNSLVAPLHPNAMPVILDEADYDRWLMDEWATAAELVAPCPAQLMTVD